MSQKWDGAKIVWALPAAVRTLPFSLCKMEEGFEQQRVGMGQEGMRRGEMDGTGWERMGGRGWNRIWDGIGWNGI